MKLITNTRRWLGRSRAKLRRWTEFRKNGIFVSRGTYIHPGTTIGRCSRINHVSHIGLCKIGAYCAVGGRLIVRSSDHHTRYLNMQDWAQQHIIRSGVKVVGKSAGDVEIGNAVWIGDSVIILSGVKIGDGAIIGAGSVVTASIPAYAVAVGNPARVIKMRFSDETISILAGIKWWNWDRELIQDRRKLFETDLTAISPTELRQLLADLGVTD